MNIFIGLFGYRIWLIQFNMTINNNDTKQKKIIKWTNNKRNNNNKKELIITYTQKQQQQTEQQQKLTRPITTTITTLPVSAATMKTKLTTFKFFSFVRSVFQVVSESEIECGEEAEQQNRMVSLILNTK